MIRRSVLALATAVPLLGFSLTGVAVPAAGAATAVVPQSVLLANSGAGQSSTYTIVFKATTTFASSLETITLAAPVGTLWPACTATCPTDYVIAVSGGVSNPAVVSGVAVGTPKNTVVVTLGAAVVPAQAVVTLTVRGVVNPTKASTAYTIAESTSTDTTPANSPAYAVVAGPAVAAKAISGANQVANVDTAFAKPLVAEADDQYGNPVGGAAVTFAAPATGASASFGALSQATVAADSTGMASSGVLVANSTAGLYYATAKVGTSTAQYFLGNSIGVAKRIDVVSGATQSVHIGRAFARPVVVKLINAFGGPMANQDITFQFSAAGNGVFDGGSSSFTAKTGADGMATSPGIIAGNRSGAAVIGVSTNGTASSVTENVTDGYWLSAPDGAIDAHGDVTSLGSTAGIRLAKPVVGMTPTPSHGGYWMVASDGGIFSFGDAKFQGSTGAIKLAQPIVGMAVDEATGGYWMVASDGGVFSFNAPFYGSTGKIKLNKPVVGMAAAPDGSGYWLVASDGGIFTFGSGAHFYGSTGNVKLAKPVVGMATANNGNGYWLVASDGGIFSFHASFFGSAGANNLGGNSLGPASVVSLTATTDGGGYWLLLSDGNVLNYGDAAQIGSYSGPSRNWSGLAEG